MNYQEPSNEILEQVSLYVLGALEGEALDTFEKRVAEGCATCRAVEEFQNVANQLGSSVKPVQPPPELRERLLGRIRSEGQGNNGSDTLVSQAKEAEAGLTFVRASDELWQEVMPGISLKPLFVDTAQGRTTALIRMAPGVRYAAHRHTAPEEFYCLEGTCFTGGQLLHPGDYHRAETGTIHYETSTEDGCLVLVIFAPDNEILDPVRSPS